ncbi:iron ABC transporter permease [Candidatus Sumerlaeota bacterium]|nr:iron ABC transporter permease [Candidatus Sumerlaeota bacterium]
MALLTQRRYFLTLLAFAGAALATMAITPRFGSEPLAMSAAFIEWLTHPRQEWSIAALTLDLRLVRLAVAFLAGGTLAVCGVAFQAMLRNPLATPYTLGVASGGALGAYCAFMFAGSSLMLTLAPDDMAAALTQYLRQGASLAGAFSTMAVIYLLARSRSGISTMGLLLAGVTLSLICSAAMMFLRYMSTPDMLMRMERWLMGGVDAGSWGELTPMLPVLLPSMALLLIQARRYDQLVFGEELAAGRGVNVARLQKITFFCGSMATAAVVAVVGPIGFIGLIVPHALRRIVGPEHRLLLPCAALGGGAFLAICDTIARITPAELPVGVLTAMLGGPFFLFLLIRSRAQWGARMQ